MSESAKDFIQSEKNGGGLRSTGSKRLENRNSQDGNERKVDNVSASSSNESPPTVIGIPSINIHNTKSLPKCKEIIFDRRAEDFLKGNI